MLHEESISSLSAKVAGVWFTLVISAGWVAFRSKEWRATNATGRTTSNSTHLHGLRLFRHLVPPEPSGAEIAKVAAQLTRTGHSTGMTDTVSKWTRSKMMSAVRAKNTRLETEIRRHLFAQGFRYRLHARNLPARPDMVFPKYATVIFVHGCFWHWHGCKRSRMPASNKDYWTGKIGRNQKRDATVVERISSMGWDCSIIWECQLQQDVDELLTELIARRSEINKQP